MTDSRTKISTVDFLEDIRRAGRPEARPSASFGDLRKISEDNPARLPAPGFPVKSSFSKVATSDPNFEVETLMSPPAAKAAINVFSRLSQMHYGDTGSPKTPDKLVELGTGAQAALVAPQPASQPALTTDEENPVSASISSSNEAGQSAEVPGLSVAADSLLVRVREAHSPSLMEKAMENTEVIRTVFNLEEGDVVITIPRSLSLESVSDLQEYLFILMRRIQRDAR